MRVLVNDGAHLLVMIDRRYCVQQHVADSSKFKASSLEMNLKVYSQVTITN
jgi:hypothetical protein